MLSAYYGILKGISACKFRVFLELQVLCSIYNVHEHVCIGIIVVADCVRLNDFSIDRSTIDWFINANYTSNT